MVGEFEDGMQGPPHNPYSPYPPQVQPQQQAWGRPPEKSGPNVLYWVLGVLGVGFVMFVGLIFAVAIFAGYKDAKSVAGPVPTISPAGTGTSGSTGPGTKKPFNPHEALDDDDDDDEDDDDDDDEDLGSKLPTPPPRLVPHHDVKMLSGCSDADLKAVIKHIDDAIALGAPRYNRGDFQGCYQTYVSTSQDIEKDLPKACKGPIDALKAGRDKASKAANSSDRAWAMRDSFDGLIDVIERKGTSL